MVIGHEFVGEIAAVGSNVNDFYPGTLSAARATWSAGAVATVSPAEGISARRRRVLASIAREDSPEFISLPMTNIWRHDPKINQEVAAIFDPFGNAVHTALSFPVLGEDVLITGAGPSASWPFPSCATRGARHVVVTDMNPFRLDLQGNGRNRRSESERDVHCRRAEAVGNGRKASMLGWRCRATRRLARHDFQYEPRWQDCGPRHPRERDAPGPAACDLQHAHHQGIYGREMYETWYKMSVMLESGVDISPVITHRFPYNEFQLGFDAMISGQTGKVVLDWTSLF